MRKGKANFNQLNMNEIQLARKEEFTEHISTFARR